MKRLGTSFLKMAGTALATLIFVLPTFGSAQAAPVGAQKSPSRATTPDQLRAKATANGQVNVIVGLKLDKPFIAEGRLPAQSAVGQQRSDIATKREALLADLAGLQAQAYTKWVAVPYVALKVNINALERLLQSPRVASIQEDGLSAPLLLTASDWIGANSTWAAGFGGAGQAVVILDTGIDADHPFFGGRLAWEACWSASAGGVSLCPGGSNLTGPGSATYLGNGNCSASLCSHGTHVAGIAAGRDPGGAGATGYSGTAPAATIIAIQVFTRFNDDGDCGGDPGDAPCVRTYDSDQISALDYVHTTLKNTYSIASINMSLGGGNNTSACDGDARKASIDNLRADGIATAIAAGNDGWTNALSTPGCISSAVTVGAVTDTDNPPPDTVASFSNMSPVVDLLAVGQGMDSSVPNNTYGNKSGTSMATPQVTGAFAVLKAMMPAWTVDQTQNHLASTGVPVTDNRVPNPVGDMTGITKPRIQLDAAVASLLSADLQVSKDCKPDRPSTAAVGEFVTCTMTVHNFGPDPAIGVIVTDTIVSDQVFSFGATSPNAPTCTKTLNSGGKSGTVICLIDAIAAGATTTITVQTAGTTGQDINDNVIIHSLTPDPNAGNNTAADGFTVRGAANLGLSKTASPNPVIAGTNLTYTLTVSNAGPNTAMNVVVQDAMPASVAMVSVTPSVGTCTAGNPGNAAQPARCTLGNMANGTSATITIVVKVLPQTTGTLGNNATVTSDTYDSDTSNNSASVMVTVNSLADLGITKTGPATVVAGTVMSYTVTVSNAGPSTAAAVTITDTLPAGVSFTGYTGLPAGACALVVPGTVQCTVGNLAPGTSVSIVIQVTVNASVPDGSSLLNSAAVSSSTTDSNAVNNTATATTSVLARSDLSITKDASFDTNNPAPRITYTLTVRNLGSSDNVGFTVVDNLPLDPKRIVYVFDTGNGACSYDQPTHRVTCTQAGLAAGGTWSVNIIVDSKGSTGVIRNTATVSSTTIDSVAGNNTAIKDVRIKGGPGKGK